MSYGCAETNNKISVMAFIFLLIMIGAVSWWAISVMREITRSMGWG